MKFRTLFLSLLFFAFAFLSVALPVFAQTTQGTGSPWVYSGGSWAQEVISGQPSLGNLWASQYSLSLAAPLKVVNGELIAMKDDNGNVIGYKYQGGVLGQMENLLTKLSVNQGISTKEYLADIGRNLGIVPKEALAQGTGFTALAPVLPFWQMFRDLAYLFYVVIFFVVGFMILMRKKIDPRTVISVEMALPKLIITLILITFSYAIMGFIVDIANLASMIIGNLFVGKFILVNNIRSGNSLSMLMNDNLFALVHPLGNVGTIASQFYAGAQAAQLSAPIAFLGALSVWAIFTFAVMFITFKIFFALLGPLTGIVLSVILAPLQLLIMAVPGSEASFGSFLKGFIAKVAVFPVTWFLLILAASIGNTQPYNSAWCRIIGCADWGVPAPNTQFSNINLNLVPMGGWNTVIGELIAFGILFTIPSVVGFVQNALKVKDQTADIATQTIRRGMSKVPFMKSLAE